MDPISAATVLTAFIPALSDGVKALFHKFTDTGPQPQNVDDAIKLMQAETAKVQALAALDSVTGTVHTWVNDVRAMQRPVAVVAALVGFMLFNDSAMWGNMASSAIFYLFGDRSYAYLKQKGGK